MCGAHCSARRRNHCCQVLCANASYAPHSAPHSAQLYERCMKDWITRMASVARHASELGSRIANSAGCVTKQQDASNTISQLPSSPAVLAGSFQQGPTLSSGSDTVQGCRLPASQLARDEIVCDEKGMLNSPPQKPCTPCYIRKAAEGPPVAGLPCEGTGEWTIAPAGVDLNTSTTNQDAVTHIRCFHCQQGVSGSHCDIL